MSIQWIPLESNPDVMNKFLENLGVPTKWAVSDVISLDEQLLNLVPTPALAFLLLFPVGPAHEEYSKQKEEEMLETGSTDAEKLYFMKQTIRNACGTVALIHAVANNLDELSMTEDSALLKFIRSTKEMPPEERGKLLEASEDIGAAHESVAQEGQTEAPNADANVILHFIALVNVDGKLFELDGRRDLPVCHGPTSKSSFVVDAAKICKEFMARDPENMNFNVMALASAQQC